jgi:hypothetical protein
VQVILTADVSGTDVGNTPCSTGFMSFNNSVALDTNSLRVAGENAVRASATLLVTGLTPWNLRHLRGCGQEHRLRHGSTFNARQITVIPG